MDFKRFVFILFSFLFGCFSLFCARGWVGGALPGRVGAAKTLRGPVKEASRFGFSPLPWSSLLQGGDGYVDTESKFLKLVAAIKAALAQA